VTVRREDFEKSAPLRVADLLRNIPGVYVSSTTNKIVIRGVKDFYEPQPLVLVDGVPIPWPDDTSSPFESPLETVSVHDVESIDVFKGANAAMFGVRASGGVISITTRRGIDVIREVEKMRANKALNYTHYTPLGYQKPAEFYSPRYETLEVKYQSIPDYRTTIFWKPDIVISEDSEASFEFYTSDFPTTYSVVIEGLTTDGRIIRQVEKIVVN
jgi:TonB-dependent SusC/RagA subfamily outer membrane receptor